MKKYTNAHFALWYYALALLSLLSIPVLVFVNGNIADIPVEIFYIIRYVTPGFLLVGTIFAIRSNIKKESSRAAGIFKLSFKGHLISWGLNVLSLTLFLSFFITANNASNSFVRTHGYGELVNMELNAASIIAVICFLYTIVMLIVTDNKKGVPSLLFTSFVLALLPVLIRSFLFLMLMGVFFESF